MSTIEDRLRAELKRMTDQAQPGQLRPLRVPGRRRDRRRWLLPAGAIATVGALIAVALVLVTAPRVNLRAASPPSGGMPHYYATVREYSISTLQVVVHDSVTGKVTGADTMPLDAATPPVTETVAAAPDDRTFYITAAESAPQNYVSSYDYRLFRVRISADGRPGPVAELPEVIGPGALAPEGMGLSPDGKLLAISLAFFPGLAEPGVQGGLQVIDLATGASRSWTTGNDAKDWPGTPVWVGGDRVLAFPWWHLSSAAVGRRVPAVRLLDIAAPGSDLLSSRVVPVGSVSGLTSSALVTSDGRGIVEAICRDHPQGEWQGTETILITEQPLGTGVPRVLLSRTEHYRNVNGGPAFNESCAVLSADPSGQHVLVHAFGLGRIDHGVFTALPDVQLDEVYGEAAW
ncbi:MAG TPA: hypothetical protein VF070_18560 [Streptosporangiaceae bacterium]